jgi:hypothetical protein
MLLRRRCGRRALLPPWSPRSPPRVRLAAAVPAAALYRLLTIGAYVDFVVKPNQLGAAPYTHNIEFTRRVG